MVPLLGPLTLALFVRSNASEAQLQRGRKIVPHMRLGLIVVLTVSAFVGRAGAQSPTPASGDRIVVHLSASGSVQTPPDLLVADLVAQATLPSAAEAQRRVNALMAGGMTAAHDMPGIDARAEGYSVGPTDDKRTAWSAQQTLELRGTDGPGLLDLAGKLQARGLVMASLDWQLSPALRRKAHDEATTEALKELMARVKSAAATLGLQVDHVQDVRLDGPGFQPRPPYPMMAMAARAMPSPQATAAPEEVTAEVSADYILKP
jgi:uncharacterized protein YggE